MKVGDVVRPKHKYSSAQIGLGVVVEVEKDFYKTYNDYFEDRLTIYWVHGEITLEPNSYVELDSKGE